MKYKIDKNVPVPKFTMGRKGKYPFSEMEEGDSFFIEGYDARKLQSASGSGRQYFNRINPKLTIQACKEGDGFRIWVIKKPIK